MLKRNFLRTFWTIALTVCFFQSSAVCADKDEWLQLRSKNFNLVGDASEKDIRRVAVRLEQFRDALSRVLNRVNFNSPTPTTVIVFKSDRAYTPFKPTKANGKIDRAIAGYFLPGEDVNYITLPVSGNFLGGRGEEFSTIFHEYTHFIVDNNFGRGNVPPWFDEGLAEYYQTLKIEDDRKVTLGAAQNQHLALLRQNEIIAFERFFSVSDEDLHELPDDEVNLFYAQSWALMHYFLSGAGGERQKQMYKFLDSVSKNRRTKEAFAEAFQTDYAALEKEFKDYIARKSFTTSIIAFDEKLTFDRQTRAAPLSEAEAKAYTGDLLFHLQRLDDAEERLKQALALDPNLTRAQISLGLVKMRRQNFVEARKYLEKAVSGAGENYLAQYGYAYVLSRKGMDDDFVLSYDEEEAAKMRRALKKSIELNPSFAEAYNLYAFIAVVQNREIDEAIVYARQALKLAPENQYYVIRLAQLDSRKHNFADARSAAQKVFDEAADESLKNYARGTLESIALDEQQFERRNRARAENEKSVDSNGFQIVTEKDLSDEEIIARRASMLAESINAALRKPAAGEKRMLGYLSKIDCDANGAIAYQFKTENKTIFFTSKDFNSLVLVAYERNVRGSPVGCGGLTKELYALVTYRPAAAAANAKSVGEIVAIEFLPAGFKPIL